MGGPRQPAPLLPHKPVGAAVGDVHAAGGLGEEVGNRSRQRWLLVWEMGEGNSTAMSANVHRGCASAHA